MSNAETYLDSVKQRVESMDYFSIQKYPDAYHTINITEAREFARLKSQEENKELVEALRKTNEVMALRQAFLEQDEVEVFEHNKTLIANHTPKG